MYLSVPRGIALGAVAAAVSIGGSAFAEIITVPNSGFESPALADGTLTFDVPGWYAGRAAAYNPRVHSLPGGPLDGENVAAVNGGGVLSTVTDATITGNTQYELSVGITERSEFGGGAWQVAIYAYDNGIHTLLDIATDEFDLFSGGPFQYATLSFDVPSGSELIGQHLKIRLANVAPGDMNTVLFDDLSLVSAAMPAPAALALFGVAGLARRRRRNG